MDRSGFIVVCVFMAISACGATGWDEVEHERQVMGVMRPGVEDRLGRLEGSQGDEQLKRMLSAQTERLEKLEQKMEAQRRVLEAAQKLLGAVSINSQGDVVFSGVNVYVQNGLNAHEASNGKGNLVIGSNEHTRTDAGRIGSHNLVMGWGHTYTSNGAILAGNQNTSTAPNASVLGGAGNSNGALNAVIVGGYNNSVGEGAEAATHTGGHSNALNASFGFRTVIGMPNAVYVPSPEQGHSSLAAMSEYAP